MDTTRQRPCSKRKRESPAVMSRASEGHAHQRNDCHRIDAIRCAVADSFDAFRHGAPGKRVADNRGRSIMDSRHLPRSTNDDCLGRLHPALLGVARGKRPASWDKLVASMARIRTQTQTLGDERRHRWLEIPASTFACDRLGGRHGPIPFGHRMRLVSLISRRSSGRLIFHAQVNLARENQVPDWVSCVLKYTVLRSAYDDPSVGAEQGARRTTLSNQTDALFLSESWAEAINSLRINPDHFWGSFTFLETSGGGTSKWCTALVIPCYSGDMCKLVSRIVSNEVCINEGSDEDSDAKGSDQKRFKSSNESDDENNNNDSDGHKTTEETASNSGNKGSDGDGSDGEEGETTVDDCNLFDKDRYLPIPLTNIELAAEWSGPMSMPSMWSGSAVADGQGAVLEALLAQLFLVTIPVAVARGLIAHNDFKMDNVFYRHTDIRFLYVDDASTGKRLRIPTYGRLLTLGDLAWASTAVCEDDVGDDGGKPLVVLSSVPYYIFPDMPLVHGCSNVCQVALAVMRVLVSSIDVDIDYTGNWADALDKMMRGLGPLVETAFMAISKRDTCGRYVCWPFEAVSGIDATSTDWCDAFYDAATKHYHIDPTFMHTLAHHWSFTPRNHRGPDLPEIPSKDKFAHFNVSLDHVYSCHNRGIETH
ncbi:hypothetical protein ml_290 [Mollivirus sibericum]|uniref:hypothetical protein n=1 Tax=Mollivirus sibericum TaxID=1678078 RepID=UPI0006B2DADD|nr:hypothetical protein ml_290 [Mollivirus sibericum]ALD62092.1 hypothetical protein ml_290 [Mollivirus sibericum]